MRRLMAALVVSGGMVSSVSAQTVPADPAVAPDTYSCDHDPSWTAPQEPFRIYGNTWHVGPRGLGVFLVTAPTGHVLIDGGVPGNAALVEANLRTLGIDPRDVKWILNSHAHCDHAGGIAQLARVTGAQVIASAADAPLLARGGLEDPQYGDRFPFPPVQVARTVTDGESLRLGDLVFTAHATPGHTRGNTTWAWKSCEGTRCLHLVDVGSLSAPEYRLIGNPKHPEVVEDYERSFARVAALPCDIALAPHPGMVEFWERVARRDGGEPEALIDPARCRAYANAARESLEEELKKQRRGAAPARVGCARQASDGEDASVERERSPR
ncbi:MAG TPA: subclass B3 metallo-beta-lactamase [Candidatus Polarisedimenticolaceae bacterium]